MSSKSELKLIKTKFCGKNNFKIQSLLFLQYIE